MAGDLPCSLRPPLPELAVPGLGPECGVEPWRARRELFVDRLLTEREPLGAEGSLPLASLVPCAVASSQQNANPTTRYAAAPIRTSPAHTIAIPAHCVRLSRSLSRTVPIKTGTSAYGADAVATSEV